MNKNYPVLKWHFGLHRVCSMVECPGRLHTVHDTTILQIYEQVLVGCFDDVFCDSIIDLPQCANDALKPRPAAR
jgi:hypothetical protein